MNTSDSNVTPKIIWIQTIWFTFSCELHVEQEGTIEAKVYLCIA